MSTTMSPSDPLLESYPPLFRRRPTTAIVDSASNQNDGESTKHGHVSGDPLPVIDFQRLNHKTLREACRDWGIFRLVNHGIPTELSDRLHGDAKEIFSIGFEAKQGLVEGSPVAYFWGTPALTATGVALHRGSTVEAAGRNFNWMEGFNFRLSQLWEIQSEDPVLDSFRFLLEEYGRHQSRIATTIFKAMSHDLNLGLPQSEPYLSPATGILRVYRYPRCLEAGRTIGLDVHTDSSVISILNQDDVGGLQVYKDDKWIDVTPIPNTLIVNLGDMMQAMSDDKYVSVKHRVKVNKEKERVSIGYFVFPDDETVIESPNYRPFTYAHFRAQAQQDIKSLGFKVGLPRFKLY